MLFCTQIGSPLPSLSHPTPPVSRLPPLVLVLLFSSFSSCISSSSSISYSSSSFSSCSLFPCRSVFLIPPLKCIYSSTPASPSLLLLLLLFPLLFLLLLSLLFLIVLLTLFLPFPVSLFSCYLLLPFPILHSFPFPSSLPPSPLPHVLAATRAVPSPN